MELSSLGSINVGVIETNPFTGPRIPVDGEDIGRRLP
jgi:hypothetical protein